MALLPVNRYRRALIDDDDYERCAPLRWRLRTEKRKKDGKSVYHQYVFAWVLINGEQKQLLLARYIANSPPGKRVWFNNGNNLDCRKSNLRVSGERLIPVDEVFAKRHNLPDIFTMLEDAANGT